MVAAAFAVYALLRDVLTPAGAAGAVVGFAALVAAIGAVVVMLQLKTPKPRIVRNAKADADAGLSRVIELVRERPIVSAAAAAAVGLLAVANPAIVTAAIRAFAEPKNRR
jgi:drug/metabolite transporter (DMT)-like permease